MLRRRIFVSPRGASKAPDSKEGKARLVVTAQSNDLSAATDTISTEVDVILRPPSVTADGFQHYINQGGSEMVLFTTQGLWSEAGVRVGKNTFRSFPAPGGNGRLALFAFPWDTPANTAPVCLCEESSGNGSPSAFLVQSVSEEIPHARPYDRRSVSR